MQRLDERKLGFRLDSWGSSQSTEASLEGSNLIAGKLDLVAEGNNCFLLPRCCFPFSFLGAQKLLLQLLNTLLLQAVFSHFPYLKHLLGSFWVSAPSYCRGRDGISAKSD